MTASRPTGIERAFELASSGRIASLTDLRRALAAEGYSTAQVVGPLLMRQLRLLMQSAAARPPESPVELAQPDQNTTRSE